jgi:hypothetical protein
VWYVDWEDDSINVKTMSRAENPNAISSNIYSPFVKGSSISASA